MRNWLIFLAITIIFSVYADRKLQKPYTTLATNYDSTYQSLDTLKQIHIVDLRIAQEHAQAEEVRKIALEQQSAAQQGVALNLGGVEQYRGIVARFWPAGQVDNALKIMACESGGNPNAVSHTNDHGLMQIHDGLANYGEQIYDPTFNLWAAYADYWKNRGWEPWSCSSKLGIG